MSKNDRKLKVAMIGVGDITFLHHPAYIDNPDAELYALCDNYEPLLKQRRQQWGIEKITTNYLEILTDPEVDIVEVNTPHATHKKLVVAALEAGKHVACQKPISTSVSDSAAMVEAAKKSRGNFRVLENFVFYPPYVKAKELIDAGEIGEALTVRFKLGSSLFGSRWVPLRSELWHLVESDNGMGQAVFDDGYHKLSMAIHLFGDIASVMGFIDRTFHYIDEPTQLIWRYKNNEVLGSFDIAFSPNLYTHSKYFPADERIEIVGTKGIISLTRCTAQLLDEPPLILYRDGKRTLFEDIDSDWKTSFVNGIRDFPKAIKENRQALLSGERAMKILQFAFGLIVSARTGREIRPDEVTDDFVKQSLGLK